MRSQLRSAALLLLVGLFGTPAFAQDFDGDGKLDNIDNCPVIANPNQADQDVDGIGNVCDITKDMVMLPDLDADGSPEVAVLVPGVPRVALREALTGELVSEIDFGPGSGCGVDPLVLDMATVPDMNANGGAEIALLMYYLPGSTTCPGQIRVGIRDGLSGALIKNLWYGAQYEPIAFKVVGDYNASGAPEIAVMGSDATDAIRVQVQDASTGTTLDNVFLGNQGIGKDFVAVSDTSGNGKPELGILSVLKDSDQIRIQLWDAVDATFQTNVWFGKVYQPQSMITMPDINANGAEEIVAIGVDAATQNVRVQVRDSGTAALHYNIWLGNNNQAVDVALINDINGNGYPDLAILLKTPAGTGRVRVQDGLNGAFIRNLFFSAVTNPTGLAVMPDYSGNGFEELATLGENAGMQHVQILDTSSGTQVKRLDLGPIMAPSGVATLSALGLSAGSLTPTFDSNILSYETTVNVAELSVTPLASDAGATITVNGTPVSSGQPSPAIPMNLGLNAIVITLTAEDSVSTTTYTVLVRRLNSEATLSTLQVSAGALSPAFDPDQVSYSILTTSISYSVTPAASDVNASIFVNGSPVASGSTLCCQALGLGNNTLTIEVIAQDGATTQTYTVTIYRQSTEARLGSLSVSAGSLLPAFSSSTFSYALTVPVEIDSTTVTAAALDGNATMTLNGAAFTGSSGVIALDPGDNVLTINVTAESGAIQSYSVTITRLNNDALLAGIAFSAGQLDQVFNPDITSYTMTVSYPFITVTPIASDVDARIEIGGQVLPSGTVSQPIDLNLGFNSIVVQVTSTDGSSIRTYIISVTRVINTNANLERLEISAGDLAPAFSPTQYTYTVEAGFLATVFEVTPYTNPTSTILVNGEPVVAGEPSASIPLPESSSAVVVIDVTAEDGVNTARYTVEVTRQSMASFAQQAYVKASDTNRNDHFGLSVVLHGNTLAVGSSIKNVVYVFVRDATGAWRQDAYLTASDACVGERFGWSLALRQDTLAVGSPGNSSVHVFSREDDSDWRLRDCLKSSNWDRNDYFGSSLALYGDTLAVGAPYEDSAATGVNGDQSDNSAPGAGAVYVFGRSETGGWSQQAYLKASNTNGSLDRGDLFGSAVALHGDTLAVGAEGEESAATGVNGDQSDNSALYAGAVYLFARDNNGNWSQQAYVKASNTARADYFGHSVALYGDTLAVGAYGEDSAATGINGDQSSNNASGAGAVYVFTRDSGGAWSEQAYVKASNTGAEDWFGWSVALHGDTLAVGATGEDSAAIGINGNQIDNSAGSSGAIYVLMRDGTGAWSQQAFVKALNTGFNDWFGTTLTLYGDTMAVGAYEEDSAAKGIDGDQSDNSAADSGAVYIFR